MSRRRARGEGSVYYDQGRRVWVGQADLGVNPVTGKRRRIKVRAGSKREAAARLRTRIDEIETLDRRAKPLSIDQLLDLWLNRHAPRTMSTSTLRGVHSMVNNHLRPALGQVSLTALRPEDVERVLDAKRDAGLSRSTLVKLHSYLSQAFDMGVRRRLIGWNPARVAVVPMAGPTRTARALVPAELSALLAAASGHRLGAWVVVAGTLGLRPGEVSGLCWDAVDLDRELVVVHRSLAWVNGQPLLKEPKTKKPRTLGMPQRTVDALAEHQDVSERERLLAGDSFPPEWRSLVFFTSNGTPLDPPNTRRMVSKIARDASIEGRVTPYDLRHTATSILSAAGAPPELLADLLGHVDTRMVFKHYRHPVTPTVDVAADYIEDAIDP